MRSNAPALNYRSKSKYIQIPQIYTFSCKKLVLYQANLSSYVKFGFNDIIIYMRLRSGLVKLINTYQSLKFTTPNLSLICI